MADLNQDPSMEEILASIKRVIAEDGRLGQPVRTSRGVRTAQPEPPREEPPEEDVLELDDPVTPENGLISDNVASVSRQSLAALAAVRQPGAQQTVAPAGDGPLEAVVREMLKPMLKDWLDQHLPEMVEELVTREIARITGSSL